MPSLTTDSSTDESDPDNEPQAGSDTDTPTDDDDTPLTPATTIILHIDDTTTHTIDARGFYPL